ncbi:MAG: response regulator, partial [Alphaproteobacteria bacterium]
DGEFLAEVNDYDLIILDLMLPKKNGITVCRELRASGVSTPVLMLTARDSVEDRVRGLDAGADDYLPKPFAFEELLARVRALLRRQSETKTPTLKLADLELDPISRRVTRAGKPIRLTTKEYALLEYLMRNAGKVLSRTLIGEHVWDMNFDPESNVIDVYISHLRAKIDKGFETPLLHTLRGQGYLLSDEAPPS